MHLLQITVANCNGRERERYTKWRKYDNDNSEVASINHASKSIFLISYGLTTVD